MSRISPVERDLRMDHLILSVLHESLLSGDLGLIDLSAHFCMLDGDDRIAFRRRIFALVGQGSVDIFPIGGEEVLSSAVVATIRDDDEKIPAVRIVASGFARFAEIEKELKKYTGLNRYLIPVREVFSRAYEMKGMAIAGCTVVLIVAIFVFDVKVSKIIEKTPLLSSVIDTELLAEFESVNEDDEFYQALMTEESASGTVDSTTTSGSASSAVISTGEVVSTTAPSTVSVVTVEKDAVQKKDLPLIPPVVQKSLPVGVKVLDIKVRSISDSEKIFRIRLEDGTLHDVRVMRVGDRYRIVDEDIQRAAPLRR